MATNSFPPSAWKSEIRNEKSGVFGKDTSPGMGSKKLHYVSYVMDFFLLDGFGSGGDLGVDRSCPQYLA